MLVTRYVVLFVLEEGYEMGHAKLVPLDLPEGGVHPRLTRLWG